jgi:hypothetical protein
MFSKNNVFAVTNAVVQTTCIVASNSGIVWAIYPIMIMVSYVSLVQTFASAGVFSGITKIHDKIEDDGYGLRALIGILYLVSSYQVYTIGYEIFSGFMFAHSVMFLLTNTLGVIKDK